jgi:serine/threonine-protein kinase RsbT
VAPLRVAEPVSVPIETPADVERARRAARTLARAHGLGNVAAERLVLAVSELATNLLRYARDGEIILTGTPGTTCAVLQVESRDRGPGIPDVALALADGFSTGGGLGNGLPAVRRLLDRFDIESGPQGTRITASLCLSLT